MAGKLSFNIDAAEIASAFKELALEVEQEISKSAEAVAAITYAKTVELANNELHSTLEKYKENLGWEKIEDGIYVVYLDEDALFIEEGIEANKDMKPDLLKNSKVSKSGKRYKVIPFDHTKKPQNLSTTAQSIVNELKTNLRAQRVPFKKIEKNQDGSPRIGMLHEFNFGGTKKNARWSAGHLDRVRIYQNKDTNGNVRRDIFTFRTVSSDQEGKWMHPGLQKKEFMDKAMEFAIKEWEDKILPEILRKWE